MQPRVDVEVTIRPARPSDTDFLAELCDQLGYPSSAQAVRIRLEALNRDRANVVYVAEMDGAPVGWVQVVARLSLLLDAWAEVEGLIVDECCRGYSAGQRLMDAAENWARAQGCTEMRVRSNVVRERAHHFYEQLGYQKLKSQAVFAKALLPVPATPA